MYGLKELFNRPAMAIIALVLCVGLSSAGAVEDRFEVGLGRNGEVVNGSGTGYNHGSWHYYPSTDWLAQWFYNGPADSNLKKVISVDLTLTVLDAAASGSIEVAVNWTTLEWPATQSGPPLPAQVTTIAQEQRYIERRTIVPRSDVRGVQTVNASIEIEDFCPAWVSIDVRGQNVSITGQIRHECVSPSAFVPPTANRDYGDAPEGVLAYPSTGVIGMFPTCVGVGPASWIEHASRYCYLGPKVDLEADGNGGKCPAYTPSLYNQDETQSDGDAGLIKPRAFTIMGPLDNQYIDSLSGTILYSLDNACLSVHWGVTMDVEVHNTRPDGREAYVNILFDWNHDGKWQGSARCPDGRFVPEHALVNFPVPAGYNGPLSELRPPAFAIGPLGGHVWVRITISDRQVAQGWNGDGIFDDGETEDYLIYVKEPLQWCDWDNGDPYKMHWAQTPDRQQTGLGVDMSWTSLADDFRCTQSGPITQIHFWGSFLDDEASAPDNLPFVISIYSNKPADAQIPWSRPGELLWSRETAPHDFYDQTGFTKAGWFDPANRVYLPNNQRRVIQYGFCFSEDDNPFIQRNGTIYWIEIKYKRPEKIVNEFGWMTTEQRLHFSDAAVWRHPTYGWQPMSYPSGHSHENKALDLAFVVVGPEVSDSDYGDAPAPYPTTFINNGASHIVTPGVYLGSLIDAEFDGQPNATATGDDSNGLDDEDGVVFSTLAIGEPAVLQVTASTQGALNAWIDWNADGDWTDAGEHVFVDKILFAGVNTIALVVPANAVPGNTFARFRFSTVRGLNYYGPAADGEVEDYQIRIQTASTSAKPPLEHVKWSQPPIERDPDAKTPVYCGWDQPAYVNNPSWSGSALWRLLADDFRCVGDMPITTVQWWGSYAAWQDSEPPRVKPDSWRIAFWSNVQADTRYTFSRPGKLLWLVSVPADRVQEERVGFDGFPGKPSDTAYKYLLELNSREYFLQADYADSDTTDRIFWISITAVYSSYPAPEYLWGWKTRPRSWMGAAIKADVQRVDLSTGITLDPAAAGPITSPLACERLDAYDMTFELATNPEFIKWEQAFAGLRNWPHYEDELSMAVERAGVTAKWTRNPDLTSTGVDVDIVSDFPPTWPATICGDDFECKTTGPITGITLWGSWYHDTLTSGSAENIEFTLSIREDIPADRSPTGYSMPGAVLWKKQFRKGQFTVTPQDGRAESYYSPANEIYERNNHLMTYKYAFKIDPSEAFQQTGTSTRPVVYWLTAQAYLLHPAGSVATRFGWSTALDHWNDAAVWGAGTEPFSGSWTRLQYPRDHSLASRAIDLAFVIETEQSGTGLAFRRVVADDWRCSGTTPITGLAWWGSYIGYGYLPCDCTQMAAPRKPDYFMLSIWTDAADSAKGFNHPGQKVWEYKAEQFDEVLVGFDKHPEPTSSSVRGFEPVYRYTVRLPQDKWFRQEGNDKVYWLSVVAAWKDSASVVYPWGWTNHPRTEWDLPGMDMLGHWKLDETTGATAADSSGNNNHGTLMGNPSWRPAGGWLTGAIELNGRDDYIKVERPKGFNFAPRSFSVSAWIYPKETRGRWHTIMEYDRDHYSNGNRFGLWLDVEGRLHFRVGQTTWQSPSSLTPDQWYHVAGTYDAETRLMDIFIDGQLVATTTQRAGFISSIVATLTIGACGAGNDEFFRGLLDDVRVFGTALSEEDVLILAGAGANSAAVAADLSTVATTAAWPWTELLDQIGDREDTSFVLFTRPWLLDSASTVSIAGTDESESAEQKK